MEKDEKQLRLVSLKLALEDLDRIIENMEQNSYSKEELNQYYKKRWDTWNEIYKVKKT
jgi:hypothetical protein